MYYQTFSESVHQRIEPIQCNSAIPITGAIRGKALSRVRLRVTKIHNTAQETLLIL